MKKLLYIVPHLSTGGLPSYTLKQIQAFKAKYDISVIEVNYYGRFDVQRDQIEKLVDFYPIYGRQGKIYETIRKISPAVISFQEVPNSFVEQSVLGKIFDVKDWIITATAHSNKASMADFTYLPDRIIAVNKWQQKKFEKEFNKTVSLWEYPIEDLRPSRNEKENAKYNLEMTGFNILNVGLFTPGKNQGEIFEVARKFSSLVTFHFVGNQAENFKEYWEPLMKNKPDNCKIWGERDDVDKFYKAADLFYFSSNYELWPISIREALSYKLPTLLKKLPSYLDEYDKEPLVQYIDNDIKKTINIIHDHIQRARGWDLRRD